MSLINEALKRADEEKRQHLAGQTPPGPSNSTHSAPRRRWGRRLAILGGVLLIVMALAAYGVWWTAGRMIRQAAAAVHQLAEQNAALAVGAAAFAPTAPVTPPPPEPGPDAQASASPAPADALAGAERKPTDGPGTASTPSPQGSGKEWRPDGLATAPSSAPPPPKTDTPTAPDPETTAKTLEPEPKESTPAAESKAPAKAPDAAAPNEAEPKLKPQPPSPAEAPAPEPKPVPEKPAPEKKAPPAPPDTSGFKISSILVGPRGGTAIINGQSVHVGETIGGAKVLEITRREVVVEIAGQRVALRM